MSDAINTQLQMAAMQTLDQFTTAGYLGPREPRQSWVDQNTAHLNLMTTASMTILGRSPASDGPSAGDISLSQGGDVLLAWDQAGSRWVVQASGAKKAPVCCCGVKFTGGRHSHWCDIEDTDG